MSRLTVSFTMLLLACSAAKAEQVDMADAIGESIATELRAPLADFLTRQTLMPFPKFSIYVRPRFATDLRREESIEDLKPASSIKQVDVRVLLRFATKDHALDVHVRRFVYDYFTERGYTRSPGQWMKLAKPTVRVVVDIAEPPEHQFLKSLTRALIAVLILILVNALRPHRRVQYAKTEPKSAIGGGGPLVKDESRVGPSRQKLHVKPDLLALPAPRAIGEPAPAVAPPQPPMLGNVHVNPDQGTWYVDSIPDIPVERLERAFSTMPLEQAIALIKNLKPVHRAEVLRRLRLHPAIKAQFD